MPGSTRNTVGAHARDRAGGDPVLTDRQAAGVTPAELQDVLLQQGYSADRQSQRLKEMLTDLTEGDDAAKTPAQRRLIEAIQEILGEAEGGPRIAENLD